MFCHQHQIALSLDAILLLSPLRAHASSLLKMDSIDRFALAVLQEAQKLSFVNQREYCGLIGFDQNNRLIATRPNAGEEDSCVPVDDEQLDMIASYHTHGSYSADADTETPSVDDLIADFSEGINGYVATPGGRVWVNSLESQATFLLCENGCIPIDPLFQPCEAMSPAVSYTISELNQREENDDGDC
ncbi:DUF4329 domain-containing protein [Ferrimonas senticii]|uniref:DUF4329 domain-containing protein n=1 Tax=Ferrimonas senticii TaxID=394566 RepID=UPI000A074584|nr:DUF4329 domain-containing protein [Ferrimonas senticii]